MNNKTIITERHLVPIQKATKTLGLTKQAIYYRLSKNIDNIADYCFLVFDGNFDKAQKWSSDPSECQKGEKRYFFEKSYLDGATPKEVVTKEEEEEFSNLYYEIVEIIEDRLEEEHKSIATETQKWANMKLVDSEVVGEIFSRYEEKEGEPLPKIDKTRIRASIKGYRFSHSRLIRITITGMADMLRDLRGEEI